MSQKLKKKNESYGQVRLIKWRKTVARRGQYVSLGPTRARPWGLPGLGGGQDKLPEVLGSGNDGCRRQFSFRECSWGRETHLCLPMWRPYLEGGRPSFGSLWLWAHSATKVCPSLSLTWLKDECHIYYLMMWSNKNIAKEPNSFLAWGSGSPPDTNALPSCLPSLLPVNPSRISSKHRICLDTA